jgi:hypothetical protein
MNRNEYFKEWYRKNKEKKNEQSRKWYWDNQKKAKDLAKKYTREKQEKAKKEFLEKNLKCKQCDRPLKFGQRKFCSVKCAIKSHNEKVSEYTKTPEGRAWNNKRCNDYYQKNREKVLKRIREWRRNKVKA